MKSWLRFGEGLECLFLRGGPAAQDEEAESKQCGMGSLVCEPIFKRDRQGSLSSIEKGPEPEQRVGGKVGLLIVDESPESRRIHSAFLGKAVD